MAKMCSLKARLVFVTSGVLYGGSNEAIYTAKFGFFHYHIQGISTMNDRLQNVLLSKAPF